MLSFKEFVFENQLGVGDNNDHDKSSYWEEVKDQAKLLKFKKAIKINFEIWNYKGWYFAVRDGQYIGHIEDFNERISNKTFYVSTAFASERGLYRSMQEALLSLAKVKAIISDSMLSTAATKFYRKIIADKNIEKVIYNYNDEEIFRGKIFGDEEIAKFEDLDYRLGITKF